MDGSVTQAGNADVSRASGWISDINGPTYYAIVFVSQVNVHQFFCIYL